MITLQFVLASEASAENPLNISRASTTVRKIGPELEATGTGDACLMLQGI